MLSSVMDELDMYIKILTKSGPYFIETLYFLVFGGIIVISVRINFFITSSVLIFSS
jgi:hypothetical protein